MKKSTARHLYWVVGGVIGVIMGILIGLYIVSNINLPNPDLYIAVYRTCATTIVIAVLIGAALGMVIGEIALLLRNIYKKVTDGKHSRR